MWPHGRAKEYNEYLQEMNFPRKKINKTKEDPLITFKYFLASAWGNSSIPRLQRKAFVPGNKVFGAPCLGGRGGGGRGWFHSCTGAACLAWVMALQMTLAWSRGNPRRRLIELQLQYVCILFLRWSRNGLRGRLTSWGKVTVLRKWEGYGWTIFRMENKLQVVRSWVKCFWGLDGLSLYFF